jgi:hypothetical protein
MRVQESNLLSRAYETRMVCVSVPLTRNTLLSLQLSRGLAIGHPFTFVNVQLAPCVVSAIRPMESS